MRAKLSLKTLYRSPVRMILTFILLVAVTFTLFSQVLEHAVTVREIDKAAEQYDGVGAVEVSPAKTKSSEGCYTELSTYIWNDPRIDIEIPLYVISPDGDMGPLPGFPPEQYAALSEENISALKGLQYISSVETRYMTGGVSEDYLRIDEGDGFYDFTDVCIIEATLVEPTGNGLGANGWPVLRFEDAELIGGNLGYKLADIFNVGVLLSSEFIGSVGNENHETALIMPNHKYGAEFAASLEYGRRYVFVARYDDVDHAGAYYLSDYLTETWSETVWDVTDAPENYLETEEYADIKRVVDIINTNDHTFDIVYTDDTESIMRFARGDMIIAEGRGIVPTDSALNPNVCVISRQMAEKYGLLVGDKITMNLGDKLFEQYKGLGAIPVIPARASETYTEVTLEIVGIYLDLDTSRQQAGDPHWSYSINTFFVPQALLNVPEEELANHNFYPGEVSIKIEDAWDISAFKEVCIPQLEEMGLTVFFEDGNWLEMEEGFADSKNLAVVKIFVLSAAVLVATWFTAMLYITGRKKDFAIMRVLGTTKAKSSKAMLIPFMTVTIIAVIVGAVAAWINTQRTIASSNALVVLSEFSVDTKLPVDAIVLCILAEVALAFAIAFLMLVKLGKKSPLELIQDNSVKRKKEKKTEIADTETAVNLGGQSITPIEEMTRKPKCARRFVWRYIFRHIRRTAAKAILTVLLCVLLLNVVGQLGIMINSYTKLVEETEITSNYVGGLAFAKVRDIAESGYAEDVYYYRRIAQVVEFSNMDVIITNDVNRASGYDVQVEFAEGYDASRLEKTGNVVIMNRGYADMNGIALGGEVWIGPTSYDGYVKDQLVKEHMQKYPDDTRSYDEIVALYPAEFTRDYGLLADRFTVVGLFAINDENYMFEYENTVFIPGISEPQEMYGSTAPMEIVEATVADNNLVDEYREFGQELAGGSVTEGVMFVMDTSKLENLRNTLRLVEMLYPIAVVVTLVIGAFLCGLIIVQTSKDIAIMRVLGTSKAKTRTILVLEQMILCVIGIIISGVVIYARGALMQMLWVFGTYALVILLASIVASAAASSKNVLELLQTKE